MSHQIKLSSLLSLRAAAVAIQRRWRRRCVLRRREGLPGLIEKTNTKSLLHKVEASCIGGPERECAAVVIQVRLIPFHKKILCSLWFWSRIEKVFSMPSFMNSINNLNKIKSFSLHLLLPMACFESVGSAFENRLFLSNVTSKGYFLSLFVFNESPRTRTERKKWLIRFQLEWEH